VVLSGAIIFMKYSRLVPVKAVTFSIIGSFLYYFIQRLFIALGTSEQMPIILATWLPSIILLGFSLLIISFIEE
jgi:lipopolysaccharide export LptBFGC system permease protein LptF